MLLLVSFYNQYIDGSTDSKWVFTFFIVTLKFLTMDEKGFGHCPAPAGFMIRTELFWVRALTKMGTEDYCYTTLDSYICIEQAAVCCRKFKRIDMLYNKDNNNYFY